MAMDAILITLGSAGDVYPFVALGRVLRQRGHRVTLVSAGYFEDVAVAEGFVFAEVGDRERFDAIIEDPRVWDPLKGIKLLLTEFVLPAVEEVYRIIEERAATDTVLVASSLAYGARAAREKLGLPLATVHLQPYVFLSLTDPPVSPLVNPPSWLPGGLTRLLWRAAEGITDRYPGGGVNDFLGRIGLPRASRIFTRWFNSPDLVLGLFPDWFGPPAPDWPRQARLTGFVRYDGAGAGLEPEVEDYLEQGEAPVVLSPGTGMAHGGEFFQSGIEACRRLGRRAMLVTGYSGHLPSPLPPHAAHFDYVPFSLLLPRAASFVHHGGIGSISQGIAAGVPQLLMPMNFDQPDNAHRLRNLGAGDFLRPRQFTAANVAVRLGDLISSEQTAGHCRELAARIDPAAAADSAVDLIEYLGVEGNRDRSD